MNGERTFGKPMPNEQIPAFMNALYNKWFKKWKTAELTEKTFMEAWAELDDIAGQGDEYPLVWHLYIAFLYEMAARMKGGYTETERDKLLELIKTEGSRHGNV